MQLRMHELCRHSNLPWNESNVEVEGWKGGSRYYVRVLNGLQFGCCIEYALWIYANEMWSTSFGCLMHQLHAWLSGPRRG